MTDQNIGATDYQLGTPMNFFGVSCKNMDMGLFTGAETDQR